MTLFPGTPEPVGYDFHQQFALFYLEGSVIPRVSEGNRRLGLVSAAVSQDGHRGSHMSGAVVTVLHAAMDLDTM
jgi:hypothetical protein